MEIEFICNVVKWANRKNGNTYFSLKITRTSDGKEITQKLTYGYEEQYKQAAVKLIFDNGWIPVEDANRLEMYEEIDDLPIYWMVTNGTKRDCSFNATVKKRRAKYV